MEKITLKPQFEEILYRNEEPGVYFDILSYSGSSVQERGLGSIFVLSYLRQKDEDLSYLVSLVSSLAKREFYSQDSIANQDPKSAFERTLKKLNDVLDDFFQKNDFTINLGLAVISADNIFISRLGKFKVALARNNEYIDILNNVELFSKNDASEHKFANIISGKIKPNDKIFAYFPIRQIISRERLLNPIFISENQKDFSKKISEIAENAANFACCGIHIDIRQIKEIPVEYNPSAESNAYSGVLYASSPNPEITSANPPENTISLKPHAQTVSQETERPEFKIKNDLQMMPPPPGSSIPTDGIGRQNVMRSEVSVAKREGLGKKVLSGASSLLSTVGGSGRGIANTGRSRFKIFTISAIVLAVLVGGFILAMNLFSTENDTAYNQASESLKLARSRLSQNETGEARDILHSALAQIGAITGKKIDEVKSDINQTLDIIDKVSDKKPELVFKTDDASVEFIKVAFGNDQAIAVSKTGKIYSVGNQTELGQLKIPEIKFLFKLGDRVLISNGAESAELFNVKTANQTSLDPLKDATPAADAAIYEGNFYLLAGGSIIKYADILDGGTKKSVWGTVEGEAASLAIDGNVWILTADGKLSKYFKGKKESELALPVKIPSGSKIFTTKDSEFIYITSLAESRIYVFDKTTGSLKLSHKLEGIGAVTDIHIVPDGGVWLTAGNFVWQIKP